MMSLYRILALIPCLTVIVTSHAVAADEAPPQRVAFVVGVSDYFHKNMEDLKYAEKDAVDVGHELKNLGFEVTQITGRYATRQNIQRRLDEFLEMASELDSNSIVLLLFSGHGQQLRAIEREDVSQRTTSAEVPFFCPRDAVPYDSQQHSLRGKTSDAIAGEFKLLSLNKLIADIDAKSNSLNNLLVIDACRNNPAKGKTPGITGSTGRELPRGISILFAAKSGQKSWESSDPKVKQGVMTHYLLQGLRGQARNRRQQITWSRLISYIQEEVEYEGWKLAGGVDMKQNPHTLTNSAQTIVIDDRTYRVTDDHSSGWTMWGGSPSRNNVSGAKGLASDWTLEIDFKTREATSLHNVAWFTMLGSQSYCNPVIAGGRVFIGTNNEGGFLKRFPAKQDMGVMVCLDERDGQFQWQYSSRMLETGRGNDWPLQGIVSTPCSDGERLWFVDNRARVVCLDADGFRDGTNDGHFQNEAGKNVDEADVLWRFDMIGQLGVSPFMKAVCSPVVLGDRLFVITGNGVDYDGYTEIPAPRAPSFICLDKNTGKLLWESSLPGTNLLSGQFGSPAILEDVQQPQVMFPGGDGWLYSFTPEGEMLWKFDCNPKESVWDAFGRKDRNTIFGLPVVHEGRVYVGVGRIPEYGEGRGCLWCIDPTKRGDVSPTKVLDRSGNAVAPRRITNVDTKRGERVVPNPNSAEIWRFTSTKNIVDESDDFEQIYHRMLGAVTVANGVVYACDYSGLFHAIDASNGRRIGYYDVFASCWSSPLVADGKVYVGDEDGEVAIFDQAAIEARLSRAKDSDIEPLREVTVPSSIYGGISVSGKTLFVNARGTLCAIRDLDRENQ